MASWYDKYDWKVAGNKTLYKSAAKAFKRQLTGANDKDILNRSVLEALEVGLTELLACQSQKQQDAFVHTIMTQMMQDDGALNNWEKEIRQWLDNSSDESDSDWSDYE